MKNKNTANQKYIQSSDINYRDFIMWGNGSKKLKEKWMQNIKDLNNIKINSKW